MTRLSARKYEDLCTLIGDALDHPLAEIREAGASFDWPTAVYLLGHRHPASDGLVVDYVGSAIRPATGAGTRIREHLSDPARRQRFTCQVLLPLRVDTPEAEVRRLEGRVARALGVPRWCQRVPR